MCVPVPTTGGHFNCLSASRHATRASPPSPASCWAWVKAAGQIPWSYFPVLRYWEPRDFEELAAYGYELGFTHMASGPLVRSSYHADVSAEEAGIHESDR